MVLHSVLHMERLSARVKVAASLGEKVKVPVFSPLYMWPIAG